MRVRLVALIATLSCSSLWAGTPGEFRGTIVDGPERSDHWVYVEGHNHSVRRVNVAGAKVRYDADVPPDERQKPVPHVFPAGTQVRVTAEQDDSGEWHASDVEILRTEKPEPEKNLSVPATSQS